MNSSFHQGHSSGYEVYTPREVVDIKRLILVESKSYRQQFIRPYELHANFRETEIVKDIVENAIYRGVGDRVSTLDTAFANSVPDIMTTSPLPITEAPIVNGWETKRFKFVLVVEFKEEGSNKSVINYIQGYTDYLGIANDTIDNDMRLIPNSVIQIRKIFDARTYQFILKPDTAKSIVYDETGRYKGLEDLRVYTPDAVVNENIALSETSSPVVTLNMTNMFSKENVVDRGVTTPLGHLGDVIAKTISAVNRADVIADTSDVMTNLMAMHLTDPIFDIRFFNTIINIAGNRGLRYFTINDLLMLDNNLSFKTQVIKSSDVGYIKKDIPAELATEDTAYLHTSNIETRLAVLIHEAIVSLLNRTLLSRIGFSITNRTGQPEWTFIPGMDNMPILSSIIEDLNLIPYANVFMNEFISTIWPVVSMRNERLIDLTVISDILSDTTIRISVDGGIYYIYRFPTFADSKYMPLIMDRSSGEVFAENYGTLLETAIDSAKNATIKSMSNIGDNYYGGFKN